MAEQTRDPGSKPVGAASTAAPAAGAVLVAQYFFPDNPEMVAGAAGIFAAIGNTLESFFRDWKARRGSD